MDFNLSDLQRMLLDSASRFIAEHYSLEHRRSLRAVEDGLDKEAWQNFAELGWLGLLIPEELGGLGASLADATVLAGALGSHCVTEPFASSAILGATLISGATVPPGVLIEEFVAGAARFALAHDEPGERYDYSAQRRTELTRAGNILTISGQKLSVLDGPSASHAVVSAEGANGLVLVLIDLSAEGIERTDYALYDGSRASDIRFDGVKVGPDAVLAEGEDAHRLLGLALDRTRLVLAAEVVGSMEAELDICAAYLKERQQFGQPIGKFQSLQHIMADMFVATHQARSILLFALSQIDAPAEQRARAVSLARLNIGEAAQLVSRQAIQLHGGYGITDEYEVSHHYRRQLVIEKQYGDIDYAAGRAAA